MIQDMVEYNTTKIKLLTENSRVTSELDLSDAGVVGIPVNRRQG